MHGVVEYDISPVRGPLANAFIILINALFFNVKLIGLNDLYPRDISQILLNEDETTFDFIVVGGGAAGCALTYQLTESGIWSVLLVEAGDYPSSTSEVPGFYTTLLRSREDWQFRLDKDRKSCNAFLDGSCLLSKGKVLGGTSTINDLLYIRGTQEDHDRNDFEFWNGNITYQVHNHIEALSVKTCTICKYGNAGLIHLEYLNITESPKSLLHEVYVSSGYRRMPRRTSIGFNEQPLTIKEGYRFNMAKAFLSPIRNRQNLYFAKNTEVQTVGITEQVDKRANGVNVSIDGTTFFLRAKKEVILAAGAINNAKLLLLSGVGDRKYLLNRHIPVQVNVPAVGKNLQFQLTLPVFLAVKPKENSNDYYYNDLYFIGQTADYILTREGDLNHTNVREFVSYINPGKEGISSPNLAVYHMFFKIGDRNLMAWVDSMNYHPKIINSLLNYNRDKCLILFLITLIYPQSRGEIVLNETHHLSNPIIRGNFLTDEENNDYSTLLSGFTYITNFTEYLPTLDGEFVNLDLPNCRNFKFCSASYVKCYIQNLAYPNPNVIGSTKMGPECDDTAVVKETLEVRQIRCLRVADSSVLNTMHLGTGVATDAMIGFRLGEILKEKWQKDYISPFHITE